MITVIPAIDIIDGRCVRLTKGDFKSKVIYDEDPLNLAFRVEDAGLKRLHLVDLDGAREGRIVNYKVLEKLAKKTTLVIDFGGGVASEKDLEIARECGAEMINVGSLAVKNFPMFASWIEKHGADFFILAADVLSESIAIKGWQEKSQISIYDLITQYLGVSGKRVLCTDIAQDGTLAGPALELYKKILEKFPTIELIASGGVSSLLEIEKLSEVGVSAVVVGKALYEGRISLESLKVFG